MCFASVLGGFRAQGRTAVKARQVLDDALAVQEAGAFAVVVECVPAPVAKAVTEALEIPTIGIGAGAFTSGQVGYSRQGFKLWGRGLPFDPRCFEPGALSCPPSLLYAVAKMTVGCLQQDGSWT